MSPEAGWQPMQMLNVANDRLKVVDDLSHGPFSFDA